MRNENMKKTYMCFGSSPSWIDGVGNISIFSDFSLNKNTSI